MTLLQLKPMSINRLALVEDPKPKKKRYYSNEELLYRYMVYMRKKGISISSYDMRRYTLKMFFTFLTEIKAKTIYRLNGDTLKLFCEHLKGRNMAVTTQERSLKNLSAFYYWLKEEKLIEKKNNIYNGFCVHAYIRELHHTFKQRIGREESSLRKEMTRYIEEFMAYYLSRGHAESGARVYKDELKWFISYLEQNTTVTGINDITKRILGDYQLCLHKIKKVDGNVYSLASRQKKLVVIRRFFKFLIQHDYIEKDPSTVIELPRCDRGLPTAIMNDKEFEQIINMPDVTTTRGLRDRTIMEVLFSTGIRNNELCHLKIEDIDLEEGLAKVMHAKGGVGFQRVVPIGRLACDFIRKYLKVSRYTLLGENADDGYLFRNNFGTRLTKLVLGKYMKDYRMKCNIKSKITAHSFRVTCATAMLRNGADVRYIQEQLGHRSLRSTQIYTRLYPKDLKKVHSSTHPREKSYKNGSV